MLGVLVGFMSTLYVASKITSNRDIMKETNEERMNYRENEPGWEREDPFGDELDYDRSYFPSFLPVNYPVIRPEQAFTGQEIAMLTNEDFKQKQREIYIQNYVQEAPINFIDDQYFGDNTYATPPKIVLFDDPEVDNNEFLKQWHIKEYDYYDMKPRVDGGIYPYGLNKNVLDFN